MADENSCNCFIEKLLNKGFGLNSFETKQEIVSSGQPKPMLLKMFTTSKSFTRHFSIDLYDKHSWLAGCDFLNKTFCWPCLLFAKDNGVWRTNGFSDLNNIHKAIKRHELSSDHLRSVLELNRFGKTQRIESSLSGAFAVNIARYNEKVRENLKILESLIDIACYLCEQDLPFRGHDETSTSDNKGKYGELVKLISKYFSPLKNQINESNVFMGTSSEIQNDLINSIAVVIKNKIKNEINSTQFVALIMDETSDISNKSQLSIILRYVDLKEVIHERFLGFWNVSADRSASNLFEITKEVFLEYGCSNKVVAQSYDGAAVMVGHLTGLQTRVRQICNEAIFIHCYAHRFNLVLSQSLSNIRECKSFFTALSGISSFFKKSSKRTSALDFIIKKRISASAPTRWQYNARVVSVIFEYKQQLTELFEDILNNPFDWDGETINLTRGFLTCLQDFKFNFLLFVFSEIFPYSDTVFECLQKQNTDINIASHKIKTYQKILNDFRDKFESFWEKTKAVVEIDETRTTRVRIDFVQDLKTSYRKLFFEIIDNISTELSTRFQNIAEFTFLELINSKFFSKFKLNFPDQQFKKLQEFYGKRFDFPKLRSELIVVYSDEDFLDKSILEMLEFLKDNDLISSFNEVSTLCRLFLTIPATSVSSERSFSALRRIKTYLRSTIGDERLSHVSLISIEKKLLAQIKMSPDFYTLICNEFKKKNRRIELNFK